MNTRVMDRPPVVLYEGNESAEQLPGTMSPAQVVELARISGVLADLMRDGVSLTYEEYLYLLDPVLARRFIADEEV